MTRETLEHPPKQSRPRRIRTRLAVVPRKPDFSFVLPDSKPAASRKQ